MEMINIRFLHRIFFAVLLLNGAINCDTVNSSFINQTDSLNLLSRSFNRHSIDSSLVIANKALDLAHKSSYQIGEINALNNLGFCYYVSYDNDKSIYYCEKALNLSRQINYSAGEAEALNNLGLTEWRTGSYQSAMNKYRTALEIADKINNLIEASRSHNYIGLIFWKIGDYPKALNNLFSSLEIKEKLKDNYEIAITLNNLSNVYNEMGNYSNAIVFANKALDISKGTNDTYTLGRALGNLGISYSELGDYPKALNFLEEAISVKQKSGEIKGLGYSYLDVGNIYMKMNNYAEAMSNYKKSSEIMNSIKDSHGLATCYNKIASLYLTQNNLSEAKKYINLSLGFALNEKLRESIKNSYLLLSSIYEKRNDYKRSLDYYQKYTAIKDSLINEQNSSQITELQVRYETTNTERENELLKQKNVIQTLQLDKQRRYILMLVTGVVFAIVVIGFIIYRYKYVSKIRKLLMEKNAQIENQKEVLQDLNKTKDKLFSIIAHDLRNPIQSMIGYSNLLVNEYDQFTDEEKKNFIHEIDKVSNRSHKLLDNLLLWSYSQTGNLTYNPAEIRLSKLFEEPLDLVKIMAKSKNLDIQVHVDKDLMVYTDEHIIKLILRNLLTNAIKFTGTDGTISLSNTTKNDEVIIKIEDSGIGMDEEMIRNLFEIDFNKSTVGTNDEKGTGLGLILCKEFVQQYNGRIWAESKIGVGSSFYFTIPLKS